MIDDRHSYESVMPPWDDSQHWFRKHSIKELVREIRGAARAGRSMWIIVPWYDATIGQHKSYRRVGDHAKMIDDLHEHHVVAFCMDFILAADGRTVRGTVRDGKLPCYRLQIWSGDMRWQEIIALHKIRMHDDHAHEHVVPCLHKFAVAMWEHDIIVLDDSDPCDFDFTDPDAEDYTLVVNEDDDDWFSTSAYEWNYGKRMENYKWG